MTPATPSTPPPPPGESEPFKLVRPAPVVLGNKLLGFESGLFSLETHFLDSWKALRETAQPSGTGEDLFLLSP